ncbi:MAG TPA: LPXTG cell wall anchor domain-containing protein [Acidimicrobiia bacterium]|nr:LPXTG cell wall anchor domain-containing protein [Acidimicrobiia bacterium]
MHRAMRRYLGIFVAGALASMVAVLGLASTASAQQTDVGAGGVCIFNVLPNPVSGFPASVHIEGTAPAGSTVTAFSGATTLVSTVTAADGTFHSPDFTLTGPTDVSANFSTQPGDGYATGCATAEGATVVRVDAAATTAQQPLAFTGSNNTPSFVLIGVAAVVVGLVLTVGARRRHRINS